MADVVFPDFAKLGENLRVAWNVSGVTMHVRQQLVRALIVDIVADVDKAAREVMLTIHGQGGQHSFAGTERASMDAARLTRRSRSFVAWRASGQIKTSPHR
jgi:hypothetical protein